MPPKTCAKSWCKKPLPDDYQRKTCRKCLDQAQASQKKCAEEKKSAGEKRKRLDEDLFNGTSDSDEEENEVLFKTFDSANDLFRALRSLITQKKPLNFRGAFQWDEDDRTSAKDKVRAMIMQVWKVTGYRFTVKNHKILKSGHYTRLFCSQDECRKRRAKKSKNPDAKLRDTLGMKRFNCQSLLTVSYALRKHDKSMVQIHLQHYDPHVHYYDVGMPEGAAAIIRQHAEWRTPVELSGEVRQKFPQVTSQQVGNAWRKVSEMFWKRDDRQITSLKLLLSEFENDIDVFDIGPLPEGIEMVCWGMKKICDTLKGKVYEIGLDATYNTNSSHLELYSILFEHDNAGFPGSYCLLTTASACDPGKRTRALKLWMTAVKTTYGINPQYIHLDKDMAEIGASKEVWDAKISLCWWHLRRAVRTRIASGKLTTTPYDAQRAHSEFSFIDLNFIPSVRADRKEYEGGDPTLFVSVVSESVGEHIPMASPSSGSQSGIPRITIRVPPPIPKPPPTLDSSGIPKIRIPPRSSFASEYPEFCDSEVEEGWKSDGDSSDDEDKEQGSRRTFCAPEYRQDIVNLMERHYCAHPLIPGYSHPSSAGIREWAVRQMYSYCSKYDLCQVWAYLWENWYRKGRWELWARSVDKMIPILKTTMMVESHWRRIKHDFLHHFHAPRLDLLAWILVTKLVPLYNQRLLQIMTETGRYRNLASWRKAFKTEWKKLETRPISIPINDAYRPNPVQWVCGCPHFHKSRFLICKHLVQAVQEVPPVFFLQVTRNRTAPFWVHTSLRPKGEEPPKLTDDSSIDPDIDSFNILTQEHYAVVQEDEELVDIEADFRTFDEEIDEQISLLRNFANGLEYQKQFKDQRFLDAYKREGNGMLQMMIRCLNRERQYNSTRSQNPRTWRAESSAVMLYKERPNGVNT
ncbi:hypothetical protein D9757_015315 [Collybiopsis confluens]|uniref:SWIM-type domain-containing protein n=1 Tax=Collybiopsis confluens TaxID=2823264 RepID=A0A8H5CPW7_9AGAR|nr:hypothetical protein D9757_015315 [Collybiopsis confluens]